VVAVGLTISPIGLEEAFAQGGLRAGTEWLTKEIVGLSLGNIIESLSHLIISIAGYFEAMAGSLFDYTIEYLVLDMSARLDNIDVIRDAWAIFRDIANIGFIFVILYVAISYILNVGRFNMGRILTRVIIVALLLNFSLFFTNVVVDASNILALQFDEAATIMDQNAEEIGFAEAIKSQMGTFDLTFKSFGNTSQAAITGVLGSVFLFVSGFVFLAGAGLLVTRFIILLLVMIFSPLAFVALIGAGGKIKKYWSMWLNKLLSWSFLAPVLTAMLYITTLIITSKAFQQGVSVGASIAEGEGFSENASEAVLNYLLITGLVVASLVIARKVGGRMADSTTEFVSNRVSRVGASAGRTFIGGGGRMLRDSDTVKRMAQSDNKAARIAGRLGLKYGDKAADASYDVRNTDVGGSYLGNQLGMSSRGTRRSRQDAIDEQERMDDRIKELLNEKEYTGTESLKIDMANQLEQAKREYEQALETNDQQAIQDAQQRLREARDEMDDALFSTFTQIEDELDDARESLEEIETAYNNDNASEEELRAAQTRVKSLQEDYTQSIADQLSHTQEALEEAQAVGDDQAIARYERVRRQLETKASELARGTDMTTDDIRERGRGVDAIRRAVEEEAQERADIRQLKWAEDLENSQYTTRILANTTGDLQAAERIRNQVRSGTSGDSSGSGDGRPTRSDVEETLRYSTDRSEDEIQDILDAMEQEDRIQES